MANYPATIAPKTAYVGTFPEIREPFEVKLNGAVAPAVLTPLAGGGWKVEIEASDVICPGGGGDGSIEVKDGSHTFTTVIDC